MSRWLVCLALFAGCALTSRGAPLEIRYFSPEPEAPAPAQPARPAVAELHLGRVTASANLETEIVHRVSPVEEDTYEALRWTEPPEAYVRRTLARALFDARPLAQVLGGDVPTLDVDVVAFEQVRHGAGAGGRVELHYELYRNRAVLARGTVSETSPAASARIDDVVAAIGRAMRAATGKVADRVLATLRAQPAPEAAPMASARPATRGRHAR